MDNINTEILSLAQIIRDYHHMNNTIEKGDLIMVLGSHDIRVADKGIELFKNGFAEKILFSGGLGILTENEPDFLGTTEADRFASRALEQGIPRENILIENKSGNTGENIRFSFEIIKNMDIQKIILVQKPYMERRTFATFSKQRPGEKISFSIASPQIPFEDYPNENIPMEKIINIIVGDLQRIIEYPKKGFQIYQEVPQNVLTAYNKLISLGFAKHLMKE